MPFRTARVVQFGPFKNMRIPRSNVVPAALGIGQVLQLALVPAQLALGHEPYQANESTGHQEDGTGKEKVILPHGY